MNEKNPFEDHLKQLEMIFSQIQEHEGPLNITPEVLVRMELLEQNLTSFHQAYDQVVRKEGLEFHENEHNPLSEQDKEFQERVKELEGKTKLYQKRIDLTLKNIKAKKKAEIRKKKSKSKDGDKWIPM